MLRLVKNLLTRIGPKLSPQRLDQIQGAVNYLRVGKWMEDRQFSLDARVRDRIAVWDAIANRVSDCRVLYLEFGVASGTSMLVLVEATDPS